MPFSYAFFWSTRTTNSGLTASRLLEPLRTSGTFATAASTCSVAARKVLLSPAWICTSKFWEKPPPPAPAWTLKVVFGTTPLRVVSSRGTRTLRMLIFLPFSSPGSTVNEALEDVAPPPPPNGLPPPELPITVWKALTCPALRNSSSLASISLLFSLIRARRVPSLNFKLTSALTASPPPTKLVGIPVTKALVPISKTTAVIKTIALCPVAQVMAAR